MSPPTRGRGFAPAPRAASIPRATRPGWLRHTDPRQQHGWRFENAKALLPTHAQARRTMSTSPASQPMSSSSRHCSSDKSLCRAIRRAGELCALEQPGPAILRRSCRGPVGPAPPGKAKTRGSTRASETAARTTPPTSPAFAPAQLPCITSRRPPPTVSSRGDHVAQCRCGKTRGRRYPAVFVTQLRPLCPSYQHKKSRL